MPKLQDLASKVAAAATSILRVALKSRPLKSPDLPTPVRPIAVLGNGPSLRRTLDCSRTALDRMDLMAVNFAGITPEFFDLKPQYYILADPHFFESPASDNVAKLTEALSRVDWPMTLFVPAPCKASATRLTSGNASISVATFNAVAVEGFGWLERLAFNCGLGMPRPRNVLIPALMTALRLGYRRIYVAGADHTWIRTLGVNERNEVVSVQPHFYAESDKELERITQVYRNVRLHEVLMSQVVAFRSYFAIERYARSIGAEIVNVTPGSFIDAFPRGTL